MAAGVKIELTESQEKWLRLHFKHTKNAEIAARLGISESAVHRYARLWGLVKTKAFRRSTQLNAAAKAKEEAAAKAAAEEAAAKAAEAEKQGGTSENPNTQSAEKPADGKAAQEGPAPSDGTTTQQKPKGRSRAKGEGKKGQK